MDDPSEKIKSILSDPESLQMIAKLAGSFMNSNSTPSEAPAQEVRPIESESVPQVAQQPMAQQTIAGQAAGEAIEAGVLSNIPTKVHKGRDVGERINLLKSIRPYLNDHRKTRVDGLIQALGTAKLFDTYTDGNLLGFLGKKFK